MKGIYYEQFQSPLQVRNLQDPSPSPDAVIIEVKAAGLCRSDWHGWMGHDRDIQLPHVPGHEFSGIIASLGKGVKNLRVGQRVVVPFCCGCGHCNTCQKGGLHICDNYFQPGFTGWGCFAEYVEIKYADKNCTVLPAQFDFEMAACLGCRFITAYRAVVDRAKVNDEHKIAVFGCGGLGLAIIMIAQALGAEVIAVDINDKALKLAHAAGANITLNARDHHVEDVILESSKGGVDKSFDALGSAISASQSILSLRKQGQHIQVGLLKDLEVNPPLPMGRVIADEIEILGSHGMPASDFPRLFHFIEKYNLQPQQAIQHRIELSDICTALPQMGENRHHGVTIINNFS